MKYPGPPILSLTATMLLTVLAGCTKALFEPVDADLAPEADAAEATDMRVQDPPVCSSTPLAACVSRWLPCDPVCQSGTCPDWCNQKCSFAYGQDDQVQVACVPDNGGRHVFPEPCHPEYSGTGQQTDDCAPGGICLPTFKGGDTALCFKLCHDSTECIFGECASRALSSAGGTVKVCDPPFIQCGEATMPCCDPLKNTGCGADQYCFLASPDPQSKRSRTLCDYSYGNGRDNEACTSARDCQRLYTCVDGACKQVCLDGSTCPSKTCMPRGSEYGYCL